MKPFRPSLPVDIKKRLWARGRLDIGWADLLFALQAPLLVGAEPRRVWPTKQAHVAMYSVRTAWDALLCIHKWPSGSEVIMSEANIPDMVRLVELHGLVPIIVPLDLCTLEVPPAAIEAAISERTRAILVSPLFGSRMNLAGIGDVAWRHNLLLVEDNAQGFSGTDFRGSPEADVTLFSFGLIKTRTALGGAVVFARDEKLLGALERKARNYQRVPTKEFYLRVVRAMGLQLLGEPFLFGLFWRALERRGINPDIWLSKMTRGMGGNDLLVAVRRRPHRSTLKLLRRRLNQKVEAKTHWRLERGRAVLEALPSAIGINADYAFFWALLVAVKEREALIKRARQEGFDISFRSSSLSCHGTEETAFSRALDKAVFLPISNPMPESEWARLLDIVRDFCEETCAVQVALSGSVEGATTASSRLETTLEL